MEIPRALLDPAARFEIDAGGPLALEGVRISGGGKDGIVRGGAYLSGPSTLRMSAVIRGDESARLTGLMLGPSRDFEVARITASTPDGEYELRGGLTDSVQRPGSTEVGITVTSVRRL
ncbi:MAG: hypothetical protein MPJ04_01035 [Nitrosopumilus sp.]|nr:hypothetical protein [Nitrosopumilus sp.]MDA7944397.1 hypothetical protein [Nitrosopumilus sp.]MDA7954149.1 hypothetical protein [Nitrosopumilus sp.]MDA7973077.1 hypothetical protein [Nitrosopumilus sp.]MDA7996493.1 hypothetical protein [Nitrosopumilus sp.]